MNESTTTNIDLRLTEAIHEPADLVLIRPLETYTEGGKKKTKVDYKGTRHAARADGGFDRLIAGQIQRSTEMLTNLFYGVCPRFGGGGLYDLAWQIRTVRVLWADLDDCRPEQVEERCRKAGIPLPSIVVDSGRGVHLYWLLTSPWLIDDVGDPPAVMTEWAEGKNGKKKPLRYIVGEKGEKLYLDNPLNRPELSPKALYAQDMLQGIANAVDGDHTTDLSRLLRWPGSMNRKDERNGRKPIPCRLVAIDTARRYSIEDFAKFAEQSPEKTKREKLAKIPLPATRDKLTATIKRKLSDYVTACDIAEDRSKADWALCCYAITQGISQGEVWAAVQGVGKFAERGEDYFKATWEKASRHAREQIYDRHQSGASVPNRNKVGPDDAHHEQFIGNDGRPVVSISPLEQSVGELVGQITDVVRESVYVRAAQPVVIRNDQPETVIDAQQLSGVLNQFCEFAIVGDDGQSRFTPLPTKYGNVWLNNWAELERLPQIKLFSHNVVYTPDWRIAKPGFDRESGIYYAGAEVPVRHSTEYIDRLLADFCFCSQGDRTNYLGILLTCVTVPHFIGCKPAGIYSGNQPELGKSILAQIVAILRDGAQAETATYNPNDEEFEKRLGAIVRSGCTTIIVDNAKESGGRNGQRRSGCIDSACLERSITDAVLSFRLLGASSVIRAENSHIFSITANSAEVSRDLITRSVVVNLHYDGNPTARKFSLQDPEGFAAEHRTELLGELLGMVEAWKAAGSPLADTQTRFNKKGWGNIIGGILGTAGQAGFLANVEQARAEMDTTRQQFAEIVEAMAERPDGCFFSASDLVRFAESRSVFTPEFHGCSDRAKATRMGKLASRYVAERFDFGSGNVPQFFARDGKNGREFYVMSEATADF